VTRRKNVSLCTGETDVGRHGPMPCAPLAALWYLEDTDCHGGWMTATTRRTGVTQIMQTIVGLLRGQVLSVVSRP
ncbi:hypothetical protein ACGLE7_005538, partial [Escherichia coli]